MWVALTGTPGTGKTAVALVLNKRGYHVVPLHRFAQRNNCIVGIDAKRKSQLVDVDLLNSCIEQKYPTTDLVLFEGHIGHLLGCMDKIVIFRCHPTQLKQRLQQKNWRAKKIKENVEAEILDVILCEAVELHPVDNIFEIDTTQKTITDVALEIQAIIQSNFEPTNAYTIGQIDWSEEILTERCVRGRYGVR
jgi:adenylate kinase